MAMLIDILATGAIDDNGQPLDSGVAYLYRVGTTTLANVYSDRALTQPAANPYTLDSNGKAEIYINEECRLVIEDSDGNHIDDIETLGAIPTESTNTITVETTGLEAGFMSNLSMTYANGVLTVSGDDANLSTDNFGTIVMNSTTPGKRVILNVETNLTLRDDAHASSDLGNLGFGITETVNWAEDLPFFVYACNKSNTDIDGVDGNSALFISRSPVLTSTPASADDIGDTGAIPTNDSKSVILLMGDYTIANYTSLPCQLIGSFRMRWSTSTDDWTIQTLGTTDGFGDSQLDKQFAKVWTMPLAQNGAATGTHFLANGGTAPIFTDNYYFYRIDRQGNVWIETRHSGDGGTDGSGSVQARMSLPVSISGNDSNIQSEVPIGVLAAATTFSSGGLSIGVFANGNAYVGLQYFSAATTLANINNSVFSNGGRSTAFKFSYKGF